MPLTFMFKGTCSHNYQCGSPDVPTEDAGFVYSMQADIAAPFGPFIVQCEVCGQRFQDFVEIRKALPVVIAVSSVPDIEPSTGLLLGLAFVSLGFARKRAR